MSTKSTERKYWERDEAIREIRAALRRRSGKAWSVTGGRGTAWGWITIEAPPARRTWGHRLRESALNDWPESYEGYDTGEPGRSMTPDDQKELAGLLGLESVHGGVGISASNDDYQEHVDRANGRVPSVIAKPYWD